MVQANSLLAMQLVAFVEKEFGLAVEDEDLDLDNFRSIRAIADFVARKTGHRRGLKVMIFDPQTSHADAVRAAKKKEKQSIKCVVCDHLQVRRFQRS
jgi:phosphopantetheine binding protein